MIMETYLNNWCVMRCGGDGMKFAADCGGKAVF
jgi:hypothetical protein